MYSGPGFWIGAVIAALIAFWVASDAKKRGMNSVGWAIGTFLLCIVFLPLYLILRKPAVTGMPGYPSLPPGYPQQQGYPSQQPGPYPPTTTTQPPAGETRFCAQCGKPHQGTMKFCPFCGAPQPE